MSPQDRVRLREEIRAVAPVGAIEIRRVQNAPSLPVRDHGYIAFRSWGDVYVALWPTEPLSDEQADALAKVLTRWDAGKGRSYIGGDGRWPFQGEA